MNIRMGRQILAGIGASFCIAATATPLALSYSVADDGPGSFKYSFVLTLDNHDGTWAAGDNYNWIIFGDAFNAPSPLTDYVGDPSTAPTIFPPGMVTSGGHNGPTFLSLVPNIYDAGWIPDHVGSTLSWSGTSSAYLGQGQLLFSNLFGRDFRHLADFEVATLQAVPEPETYAMMLTGLGLLAVALRRRKA